MNNGIRNKILHDLKRIAQAMEASRKTDEAIIQAVMEQREHKAVLKTQLDRLYEDLENGIKLERENGTDN
jgi:hypothetical protein